MNISCCRPAAHRLLQVGLALLLGASVPYALLAQDADEKAEPASVSADIYDFSSFTAETVLNLFYAALQQGRNYPTDEEFAAAGILPSDVAFIRSHVRRADIISRSDRLLPATYEQRELWMNIPMGTEQEKNNTGGYPGSSFDTDAYSMWQYTHLFGSWNHCFFQAPGAWVDAAHKNGTDILSGLKFFESWNVGDDAWVEFCTVKNDDGSYKYVKPLINSLLFFGADGINFNWEDDHYENADVVAFHKALYKEAAAQGFNNFHVAMYTENTALAPTKSEAIFGSTEKGKTTDLMLNYADGDFSAEMGGSSRMAQRLLGTTEGIYGGVHILSMNRAWPMLDIDNATHQCNICLWGEHGQTWFWANTEGENSLAHQANYQRMLERGFSGGNRNPALRPEPSSTGNNWKTDSEGNPPLSSFCGLAEFIPERSAIQGNLPFETFFNLGNGAFYHYKGRQTAGSWHNMGNQDYVPTFRWLVYEARTETVSTKIQPEFTHTDAYMGGACLSLQGRADEQGTDIILYKTLLKVSGNNAAARLALKSADAGTVPSSLHLLLHKQNSNEWEAYAVGNISGGTWQNIDIPLTDLHEGDIIDRIALRVKGTANDEYQMLVGQLRISDDAAAIAPLEPAHLVAEVRQETKESLTLKLAWTLTGATGERAAWNMLFNDEAGVHHFEIFSRFGENGKVREVMRTTQWAALVSNIHYDNSTDDLYIGVRSVSTDLRTYSPVEWLHITRSSSDNLPDYISGDTLKIEGRDAGEADEPEHLTNKPAMVNKITDNQISPYLDANGVLHTPEAEALWIYATDGRLLRYAPTPHETLDLHTLRGIPLILKVQQRGIIRSLKCTIR